MLGIAMFTIVTSTRSIRLAVITTARASQRLRSEVSWTGCMGLSRRSVGWYVPDSRSRLGQILSAISGILGLMTDTPARLLNLLSLLQTPREWPGSELADRLQVSPR